MKNKNGEMGPEWETMLGEWGGRIYNVKLDKNEKFALECINSRQI